MSGYNAHQQVFQLSLMSFLAKSVKGTQTDIQAAMEKKLPHALAHLPGWEIVWGPVAWKFGPDHKIGPPDHVFFVVKHPNLAFSNGEKKETYVLSIAGTQSLNNWGANGLVSNGVNFHEWLKRGITTKPVKDESPSPSSCYIAEGTADGVYRLVTVVPPPSAASPGVDIPTYWASFPDSPNTRVIITGHSMGGALAPTLALGLLESGALAKFSPSNVLVYPTAGPTAGNLQFAKLFADRFPKVPGPLYEVWNCMIVNLRDPVTQAWCASEEKSPKQNMHNIPTIFGEPALDKVKEGVDFGIIFAGLYGFTYMPIQAVWFEGTLPPSPPTDIQAFFKLVLEQHTEEYLKLMKIKRIGCQVLTGEETGVEGMSSSEAARTEPLMYELAVRTKPRREEEDDLEDYQSIQTLSENCAM